MHKKWLAVLGTVVLLAAVGLVGCGGNPTTVEVDFNQQEGIWVNGTGEVTAVPDVATLSLGIETEAASVSEAQAQAAAAMAAVMQALEDNGVAENDIQTQYFNISQVTRWDDGKQEPVVTGYRVTNMVTAKLREIGRAGGIIDAVAAAGGDLARVNSIGFTVDDPSDYQAEARILAVADARAKAESMAAAAGVTLGDIVYLTESSYIPSPIYRQDMMAEAAAGLPVETPISPGELEISVNVQINYAID